MYSLVFSEHELSGERLPTQTTPVGFLSCMNDLVISEPGLLDEGFPTFTAYMRLVCFLCFLMLDELGLSIDEFPALREFSSRMKLFIVSMQKGFPISSKICRVLYLTPSALVK